MTADKLLSRLEGVRATGEDRWSARCPAHEDRSPSLSVRETGDGTVLLRCFAGCGAADVVAAVGLEFSDLFPPRTSAAGPLPRHMRPAMPARAAQERLSAAAHEAAVLAVILSDLDRGEPLTAEIADRFARASSAILRLAEPRRDAA